MLVGQLSKENSRRTANRYQLKFIDKFNQFSGLINFFVIEENTLKFTQQNDLFIASFIQEMYITNIFFNSSSRFLAEANVQVEPYVYMADMKHSSSEKNVVILSQMKAIQKHCSLYTRMLLRLTLFHQISNR